LLLDFANVASQLTECKRETLYASAENLADISGRYALGAKSYKSASFYLFNCLVPIINFSIDT